MTPRLIGKKPEEAARIIDRMGLQYQVSYHPAPDKQAPAERVVVVQKPAAGGPVAADGTVEIVVNK